MDRHRAARFGKANEAAGDFERPRGLSHGDCQHVAQVELGADLARNGGDQALAFERGPERLGRPAAAEGKRGLVGEPLEELELARREETPLREDGHDENAREPALGDQWQEGGALRRHRVESAAHVRCSLDVVNGKRCPLARHGCDPARILDEVDLDPLPPILVGAPGRKPRRKALRVVHDGEHRRFDPERLLQLVEQVLGCVSRAERPRKCAREPRHRTRLALPLACGLFSRPHPLRGIDEQPAVVPGQEEDSGHQAEERQGKRGPGAGGRERLGVAELRRPKNGRGHTDDREEEPQREAGCRRPPPSSEQGAEQERGQREIERRGNEKRHRIDEQRRRLVRHWAH